MARSEVDCLSGILQGTVRAKSFQTIYRAKVLTFIAKTKNLISLIKTEIFNFLERMLKWRARKDSNLRPPGS